ncbi:MAG: hypothetical protein AAB461_00815 [Patescibacteria group bacterium]
MAHKPFTPQITHQSDAKEQLAVLQGDDVHFSKTKGFMDSSIIHALNLFEFSDDQYKKLHKELLDDIEIAAKRFLGNKINLEMTYKFSTYFGWYIGERINPLKPKRKNIKTAK